MGEIVTDPGDLSEAGSAPEIEAVAELGGGDVVLTGEIGPATGDGVAVIGEALWVRGQSFGRLPTVTIAGRPAAVLARTTDGGLVVRVPPTAPAGAQSLTVTNDRGRADFPLAVRRLVVTLPPSGGRLALVDLAAEGPTAAGEVLTTGRLLRVGSDGRAAYVLDPRTAQLTVIELPAQGGPRAVFNLELGPRAGADPVIAFAAAAQAQALMLMRSRDLLLLDTTSALHPTRGQPRPLPAAVQKGGVTTAALSPDARLVAVALEEGNRVALLDLQHRGVASMCAELALAPEARVPVLVDVAFAPDGRTLWVVLGDTPKSRAVGPQPTEIVAVRLDPATVPGGPPVMTIARRVRIDDAEAPDSPEHRTGDSPAERGQHSIATGTRDRVPDRGRSRRNGDGVSPGTRGPGDAVHRGPRERGRGRSQPRWALAAGAGGVRHRTACDRGGARG